jgi:acetyl-CoA carboxylase biotin carboxyl carrier protein
MIDLDFIERLIKVVDESGLESLDIERGGTRVRLAKTPPVAAATVDLAVPRAAAPSAPASNLVEITAPMVGTFYLAPAPDAPAYVEPGTTVKPGDTICIIEAMKLMNELECEISGTVREICVENAQPVEFGQVLFRVEPG